MFDIHGKAMEEHVAAFQPHERQLQRLKNQGFKPEVIYDIGACVLHWTRASKKVFPDAKYILFDAWEPAEPLYTEYDYHIGVLCDSERDVTFYQNDEMPYGNSYYREIGTRVFPESTGRIKHARSLDDIVRERGFPPPDLIKIDVQGAEKDIMKGGIETLKKAKYLIVEMQHTDYNKDAPHYDETGQWLERLGWKCIAWRFVSGSIHNVDADYIFENTLSGP
jgi:FkbM family methyltransferase